MPTALIQMGRKSNKAVSDGAAINHPTTLCNRAVTGETLKSTRRATRFRYFLTSPYQSADMCHINL
jgi:hypothetical protein